MNRFSAGIATSAVLLVAAVVGGGFALASGTSGLTTTQIRTAAPGPVDVAGAVASEGSSLAVARADHTHSLTGTLPAGNGGTGQSSYTTGDLLYASSSSTLGKLAAGTATYVLTSNGAGTPPSWEAATGGGADRRTDGTSCVLSYPMDETALPFANEGTAGSAGDFDTAIGSPTYTYAGLFNNSLFLNASTDGVYASGSTGINTATPITITYWAKARSYSSGFGKLYRPVASGLSNPFFAWNLRQGTSTGRIDFYFTTGGTLRGPYSSGNATADSTGNVPTGGDFYLVHAWYDGTNAGVGHSGTTFTITAAVLGALDYGTNGELFLGQASGEPTVIDRPHWFADPRVYASKLTDAQLTEIARKGWGRYP